MCVYCPLSIIVLQVIDSLFWSTLVYLHVISSCFTNCSYLVWWFCFRLDELDDFAGWAVACFQTFLVFEICELLFASIRDISCPQASKRVVWIVYLFYTFFDSYHPYHHIIWIGPFIWLILLLMCPRFSFHLRNEEFWLVPLNPTSAGVLWCWHPILVFRLSTWL